jgi:NTE family protein
MKTIENLAFKGGGVLGAAYAGVYKALQEVRLLGSDGAGNVYGNVKRVAGTSAGAIFATMVALGLTAEQTAAVLKKTNFQDFLDWDDKFAEHGGFLIGDLFLNWMRQLVRDHLPSKLDNPTFADLADAIGDTNSHPLLYKDLHVFSHQDWPGRTVEFSAQTTPDVQIAEAVRASMSIPFIFQPWTFVGSEKYPGPFFDGGTSFNYPVSAFDSGEANKKTLGFYLSETSFDQQGLFPELLVHIAMNTLQLNAAQASIVEAIMEWAKQALQRGYIGSLDQVDLVKVPLTDAVGAKSDLQSVNTVLKALSDAQQKMAKSDGKRAPAIKAFNDKKLITDKQFTYLTAIDNWYGAICAVQNTPTNMVFDRDASRSIFIDTLGYLYFDFWLPECDKQNLIDSGYASTRSYLSFIMYS